MLIFAMDTVDIATPVLECGSNNAMSHVCKAWNQARIGLCLPLEDDYTFHYSQSIIDNSKVWQRIIIMHPGSIKRVCVRTVVNPSAGVALVPDTKTLQALSINSDLELPELTLENKHGIAQLKLSSFDPSAYSLKYVLVRCENLTYLDIRLFGNEKGIVQAFADLKKLTYLRCGGEYDDEIAQDVVMKTHAKQVVLTQRRLTFDEVCGLEFRAKQKGITLTLEGHHIYCGEKKKREARVFWDNLEKSCKISAPSFAEKIYEYMQINIPELNVTLPVLTIKPELLIEAKL